MLREVGGAWQELGPRLYTFLNSSLEMQALQVRPHPAAPPFGPVPPAPGTRDGAHGLLEMGALGVQGHPRGGSGGGEPGKAGTGNGAGSPGRGGGHGAWLGAPPEPLSLCRSCWGHLPPPPSWPSAWQAPPGTCRPCGTTWWGRGAGVTPTLSSTRSWAPSASSSRCATLPTAPLGSSSCPRRPAEALLSCPQCVSLDKIEAVGSEEELVSRALELLEARQFWAGVVFLPPTGNATGDPAPHIRYKIRMDIDDVTRTNKIKDRCVLPRPMLPPPAQGWGMREEGRLGIPPSHAPRSPGSGTPARLPTPSATCATCGGASCMCRTWWSKPSRGC